MRSRYRESKKRWTRYRSNIWSSIEGYNQRWWLVFVWLEASVIALGHESITKPAAMPRSSFKRSIVSGWYISITRGFRCMGSWCCWYSKTPRQSRFRWWGRCAELYPLESQSHADLGTALSLPISVTSGWALFPASHFPSSIKVFVMLGSCYVFLTCTFIMLSWLHCPYTNLIFVNWYPCASAQHFFHSRTPWINTTKQSLPSQHRYERSIKRARNFAFTMDRPIARVG